MKKIEHIEPPADWPVNPYNTLDIKILAIPIIGKWLAQNSTNTSKILVDERDQQILRWLKKQGVNLSKNKPNSSPRSGGVAQDTKGISYYLYTHE